jgi:hypothetical protein
MYRCNTFVSIDQKTAQWDRLEAISRLGTGEMWDPSRVPSRLGEGRSRVGALVLVLNPERWD